MVAKIIHSAQRDHSIIVSRNTRSFIEIRQRLVEKVVFTDRVSNGNMVLSDGTTFDNYYVYLLSQSTRVTHGRSGIISVA